LQVVDLLHDIDAVFRESFPQENKRCPDAVTVNFNETGEMLLAEHTELNAYQEAVLWSAWSVRCLLLYVTL
jgi:hypothetical protein